MKVKQFFSNHLDDILLVTGAGLVIYATSLLSYTGAFYVAGAFCITGSILIGIGGKK